MPMLWTWFLWIGSYDAEEKSKRADTREAKGGGAGTLIGSTRRIPMVVIRWGLPLSACRCLLTSCVLLVVCWLDGELIWMSGVEESSESSQ